MSLRTPVSLLVGLLTLFHTWGAWALVQVNMEDKVEAFIRDTAQITCMYTSDEGIGGMVIEWSYVKHSGEKQRIFYQDPVSQTVDKGTPYTGRINVTMVTADQEQSSVVLTISDVQVEDEREFICLIKSLTDGVGEGRTKLHVFATPERPTIEAVQTGISINEEEPSKVGTCEVKNGYPKPNITWYRNGMPLHNGRDDTIVLSLVTKESSGLFSVRSELKRKVVREDEVTPYYCEANYFVPGATKMTETEHINVVVFYPSTEIKIWVESPKGKIKEGDMVEFQCSGNGNHPSVIYSISNEKVGKSWDLSTVQMFNVTREDSGTYQCQQTDTETWDVLTDTTDMFVNYLDAAVVTPEKPAMVVQGHDVTASCNALSSLHTEAVWSKNGVEISRGHTLTLKNATFDTSGTYTCVVSVPEVEDMKTNGTLTVHIQGPPQIMKENTELETLDNEVSIICHARGFPAPTITWIFGEKVSNGSVRGTEDGVESELRVQVSSDSSAVCNASNAYGSDAVTFNIKATKTETVKPPKESKKESKGVIIAVIIICLLLLAILGSVLYFLFKKGKICGRSGKQDLTKSNKDNIVVEMKSDNTEEAILLGVNGEKQPPSDQ